VAARRRYSVVCVVPLFIVTTEGETAEAPLAASTQRH
jgi:hypothetical protein